MEGHRFFDLQRYSVKDPSYMATQINNYYLKYEKGRRPFFGGVSFTQGKNEYFPIPQSQIDLSKGSLTQDPAYN